MERPPGGTGDPPLEELSIFERTTFRLIDGMYRNLPNFTEAWLRNVSAGWMTLGSRHMMFPLGLERLAGLKREDGILLVSNHRSFFDLYMLFLLLQRHTTLRQRALCPVRGEFFYQQWSGLLVNLFIGAGRMFPPFFREPNKQPFNKWALDRVTGELRRGEILVGFHPEGTRNKNESPYQPLPAQPGVGKIVMDSWPIIVPAFINGLSNDIAKDVWDNMHKRKTVVAVFGEPIDLNQFRGYGNRLSSHKKIADALLKRIYELGAEERIYRAKIDEARLTDPELSGSTFRL